jgi:hypothetical protein
MNPGRVSVWALRLAVGDDILRVGDMLKRLWRRDLLCVANTNNLTEFNYNLIGLRAFICAL